MEEAKLKKTKQSLNVTKKLKYSDMVAMKIVVKLDPLQIGIYYKRFPGDKKNKLYIVELQNIVQLGDPFEITTAIYTQHGGYFHNSKVPFNQVYNIIEKMLEFIENEFNEEVSKNHSDNVKSISTNKSAENIILTEEEIENVKFITEMKKEKNAVGSMSKNR